MDHGHSSDTTASGKFLFLFENVFFWSFLLYFRPFFVGMSDEEGSNAATEGSTLRISPVEDRAPKPPGSFESESVGSGAESGKKNLSPMKIYFR